MNCRRRNLLAFVPKRLGHACKDKCAVAEFMNKSGYNASWAIVSSYHNESILHDGGWRVLSRRCETALAFKNSRSLTAGVWWRPRCTASSAWASGRWRARLSVRLWSCMCVWLCSTASPSSDAQQRGLCLPWHSCVWSWGHLVCLPTCATKPFGYLVLTPLVPVLLWAFMDRESLRKLWMEEALSAALDRTGVTGLPRQDPHGM